MDTLSLPITPTTTQYPPDFVAAVGQVLSFEGGLSEDSDDPGGVTKYGISQRSYPGEDIRHLTQERAIQIYYEDWWSHNNYGCIGNPQLAAKVFLLAANMGHKAAVRLLQRASNQVGPYLIVEDGFLGLKTFEAVGMCNPGILLDRLKLLAVGYYLDLRKPKYLAGWIRRAIA